MYILISDFYYQSNPSYFFARGEWLERIKKYHPNYADISTDDVEEILLYSSKKADAGLYTKTVRCAEYSADENYLRSNYGEVLSDAEMNCDLVRKNI
jgi:hypothetical protein